jgi:hypothetical protein
MHINQHKIRTRLLKVALVPEAVVPSLILPVFRVKPFVDFFGRNSTSKLQMAFLPTTDNYLPRDIPCHHSQVAFGLITTTKKPRCAGFTQWLLRSSLQTNLLLPLKNANNLGWKTCGRKCQTAI